MQNEDLSFIISIILICLCGVLSHSLAIKLQFNDYRQCAKATLLIALSCSEIAVCLITITIILLPLMVPAEVYRKFLPYVYCVKLIYVILEHILSIDSLLRVRWNIYYKPHKMNKLWRKFIVVSLCSAFGLMAIHACCSTYTIPFKIGLFAESSLIFVIFSTYIYILVRMNKYRVLPVVSSAKFDANSCRKKQLTLVWHDLRPTLSSVPILILLTHLPFAGIPNLIFLVLVANGKHISGRFLYVKFLLSALGLVIDAVLYVFSQPKIRRKIKRHLHRSIEMGSIRRTRTKSTSSGKS